MSNHSDLIYFFLNVSKAELSFRIMLKKKSLRLFCRHNFSNFIQVHAAERATFECGLCGHRCSTKNGLTYHLKVFTSSLPAKVVNGKMKINRERCAAANSELFISSPMACTPNGILYVLYGRSPTCYAIGVPIPFPKFKALFAILTN